MKAKRSAPLEREIKLRVADARTARAALKRIGASLESVRQFEDNFILDDESRSLSASGCLLRLRRLGSRAMITFKGPKRVVHGVKQRFEVEFDANDAEAADELFSRLGYRSVFRYQKYRAVYAHERVEIMLDETPIGAFFEIEGRLSEIRRAATALGYTTSDFISDSYADLFFASGGSGHMVFR
jgi:adenylate cyclase class 2